MAHLHSIPHHGSTATNVVSHTESDFDQLLVEVSPREFDEDIEFEDCLRYLEHAMAVEDEEDWEDDFMHLLEDELPSPTAITTAKTRPVVGVTVHDVDDLGDMADMEQGDWDEDVHSLSTSCSLEKYSVPLRDTDIVCSHGVYSKEDHPGNRRMKQIIAGYVTKWGKATTSQQQDLLVQIVKEIEIGFQHPRFLFAGIRDDDDILYCREASTKEVEKEIKDTLLLHFNIIPTDHDYIFGKGKPIYNWPGNVTYREYMSQRIPKYRRQDAIGKRVIINKVKRHVARCYGRFLYPFDNAKPGGGCINVDDEGDIEEKLKSVLRESKGGHARSGHHQRDSHQG